MLRMFYHSILLCRVALSLSFASLIPAAGAHAEQRVVGIVVDYQPRGPGEALIAISRKGSSDGEPIAVKEHEILYVGDRIVFAESAGPKAYVKALVGAEKEITLDRTNDIVPETSWPFLQAIVPKLLAAYRWVNATRGDDSSVPRNAVSRGLEGEPEALVALPKAGETLVISETGKSPLWIGWAGGTPPFKVSIAGDGKARQEIEVCKDGSENGCVREALLDWDIDASQPAMLTIQSSDGSVWSRAVKSGVIVEDKDFDGTQKLGSLGVFLHATGLLSRDPSTYVLESARELATISGGYPPARTLLNEIRSGQVP